MKSNVDLVLLIALALAAIFAFQQHERFKKQGDPSPESNVERSEAILQAVLESRAETENCMAVTADVVRCNADWTDQQRYAFHARIYDEVVGDGRVGPRQMRNAYGLAAVLIALVLIVRNWPKKPAKPAAPSA